jgi:hypothetical protein
MTKPSTDVGALAIIASNIRVTHLSEVIKDLLLKLSLALISGELFWDPPAVGNLFDFLKLIASFIHKRPEGLLDSCI